MPELPEVETIINGLRQPLEGSTIHSVVVRHQRLRWPIPQNLSSCLVNQTIDTLIRRGKYILIRLNKGTLIIHLGMSGSLRLVMNTTPLKAHDHVDIIFSDDKILRYNDPRRFGAILWTDDDPLQHPLLKPLGMEPLCKTFTADYLKNKAIGRRLAIKPFIMDGHVVVGIGNIYAAEALFLARIHPTLPSHLLTPEQWTKLVASIQIVLIAAIAKGGTTLKDFVTVEGKPGYFFQELNVYGRSGLPCLNCCTPLQSLILGQRNTVFCSGCQTL